MITRISKIARLPAKIREQLNRRLHNGQTGGPLLNWVNQLPETQEVLADLFNGNAITHQNLSEWRRAGYQDWLRHQQQIEWFDHFSERETELAQHDSCPDTFDAMGRLFIIEIGQRLAALQDIKNPEQRSERMERLAREFARLQNAYTFACRVHLDWDKHNAKTNSQPSPSIDEDEETIEEDANEIETEQPLAPDEPQGAPTFCRLTAGTSPEPHMEPEASSPSPPQKGGEGRGEEALTDQRDHQRLTSDEQPAQGAPTFCRLTATTSPESMEAPPCLPTEDCGLKTVDSKQTCQAITPYSPTPPPPSRPTPVHKHIVHSIPIRGRRFVCIEG